MYSCMFTHVVIFRNVLFSSCGFKLSSSAFVSTWPFAFCWGVGPLARNSPSFYFSRNAFISFIFEIVLLLTEFFLLFLLHLNVTPLPLDSLVSNENLANRHIEDPFSTMSPLFLWTFKRLTVFRLLRVWHIFWVYHTLLEAHWASWMHCVISFTEFADFWPLFLPIIFLPPLFHLSFWGSHIHIYCCAWQYLTDCFLHPFFFFSCSLEWIILINLSSSLMFISSISSNLLMNLSGDFILQVLVFNGSRFSIWIFSTFLSVY